MLSHFLVRRILKSVRLTVHRRSLERCVLSSAGAICFLCWSIAKGGRKVVYGTPGAASKPARLYSCAVKEGWSGRVFHIAATWYFKAADLVRQYLPHWPKLTIEIREVCADQILDSRS